MQYCNPIIKGFYPDPSICKNKDTYYMVCSSFQYFPGVPLFESKDLINWNQIGNVLTSNEQLPLSGAGNDGGIYAPTIRCHNGRFFMVTTNIAYGHFYVWTDDIYGTWSSPIWVDQSGIDPSLYFEDEKAYFMSNGQDEAGNGAVIQCEIDIETGKKLTSQQIIWHGAGGRYLESPHLYHIGKYYYLLAAEGGTEYGHMVVYARGVTPYGPFENYADNPVLTNRNLGGYLIQGCGHGDLIQDEHKNWWMVHLAFRQIGLWQPYHHLGREVCLVPVTFDEKGWFYAGEQGITPTVIYTERIPNHVIQKELQSYDFKDDNWQKEWCHIRNPHMEQYKAGNGYLRLKGTNYTLDDNKNSPTFLGLRQREMHGRVFVELETKEGEAGITIYMDENHHYDFAVRRTEEGSELLKRRCVGDMKYIQQKTSLHTNTIQLEICFSNEMYSFTAYTETETIPFGTAAVKYLSTEVAGGFTGVMIGLYAQEVEKVCQDSAYFTNFICEYD